MRDQWVRTPAQQEAIDLQRMIDMRPSSDVVVRTYPGEPAEAYAAFQVDAAQMIPARWQPIAQQYVSSSPSVARVALLGLFAFASKPAGSLVVTYQYQRPQSGTPVAASTEAEQQARPTGSDPQAAGPG
jgi:hypothetical protein